MNPTEPVGNPPTTWPCKHGNTGMCLDCGLAEGGNPAERELRSQLSELVETALFEAQDETKDLREVKAKTFAALSAHIAERYVAKEEVLEATPCGYCGKPVEPVVTVTQKEYCNHSHRQLAYKQRQAQKREEKHD